MKELFSSLIFFSVIITLLSLITPQGRMKKSTTIALSFILSLVLVSFFLSFSKSDINYEQGVYEKNEEEYQEKILSFVCGEYLGKNGIFSELISIELNEDNYVYSIKKIYVKNPKNKDGEYSGEKTVEKLCEYFNVKEEQICIYE